MRNQPDPDSGFDGLAELAERLRSALKVRELSKAKIHQDFIGLFRSALKVRELSETETH